ncbi:MAG TPA: acetyl-CoA hydrolase/transferase C-terminal domain-containing protein [Bryobacteraceae bacterium]|nr:acetyl-CoA hydrolase/transferase C-terminal domain-containing protein [Bryobacteraceae bacterium]
MGGVVFEYQQKVTAADRAVDLVRSGDRVWVQQGCGTPITLLEALTRSADRLQNVEICHMLTCGSPSYLKPEYEGHFRHNGLFLGGNVRQAVADGRADYTPVCLSEIERLFDDALPIDVAFVQTSPPDGHGYLSLGIGADCTLTAARRASHIIVEMNERMPRALGDTFLHVSQIAAIVPVSRPLLEITPEPPTAEQTCVAEHVASLVPDGSTLQMGIGGIPNAVLALLQTHRDLGIHSEMCPDGVVPLIESGTVNGARKTLHRGKVIAGFVLGSQRLFDYIDNNPVFEFHPSSYVNDPFVIAQNDNMIAINSAIQVDLTGQVCADSIGTRPYSGFGGQLDFMRGAGRSKGGKPVIALPATARDGAISRIVPVLEPGAGVVTPRSDVHYVVTEYGIAYLRGKTLRQRAEALISIAHPRFRDELYDFAVFQHYLEPRAVLV